MPVVLSHESSLRYWLTSGQGLRSIEPNWSRSLAFASGNMRDIKQAELPFAYSNHDKLHVLVGDHASTRNQLALVTHRWTRPIPSGSLYEYDSSCLICSPEFTFLQLAASRTVLELIQIGTYLCASFSMSEAGAFGELCSPASTMERLEDYLACSSRAPGVAKARTALRHVLPNTASPMEILIGLAFTLPTRLGGWGYPDARANEDLTVPQHLRGTLASRRLRCDLYFPSIRGDIEYDSAAFHSGAEQLDYTQTRRNILEAMGVKTISATKSQVRSFERFEDFMWMAIERLGLPWRPPSAETRARQHELYDFLTGHSVLP